MNLRTARQKHELALYHGFRFVSAMTRKRQIWSGVVTVFVDVFLVLTQNLDIDFFIECL